MCGSIKKQSPYGRSLEILSRKRSQRPKFLKESMKQNLEFPEGVGGGGGDQILSCEGMDVFWNNTTHFLAFCFVGERKMLHITHGGNDLKNTSSRAEASN